MKLNKLILFLSVFVLYLAISLPALAFSTRTESWKEDALLHDGRTITVERKVDWTTHIVLTDPFFGLPTIPHLSKNWPDKFWIKFENPDTHKAIKWQGEQYFSPVLLDIVDGVPYLVVHGRTDKNTEKIYGCPELPYIFLKYEDGFVGKWIPIPVEQAPSVLQDANLSPSYDSPYGDLSRDQVLMNIRKVEGSSGGGFQAKIPRSYDDWYSIYKGSYRDERRMNDCRPPPTRPLPSPKFEATRQHINEAGLKAKTINASIESFAENPEIVTPESFSSSKGVWTGNGYLSNRCDGIVKSIVAIREYFDNGGWHLTGSQLVLKSGEDLPFQQTNISKFQAPTIPQLVTCGYNAIYAVTRVNKENLLIHRFTYSGGVIDALHVVLPDTDKIISGKDWGDIWEVMPMKDHLTIALADYTYTSTANLGGTIKRKQTYAVKLPKLLEPEPSFVNSTIEPKVDQAPKAFRDCEICPEMVPIPGKNYAIGKYEVTQAEWQALLGVGAQEDRSGSTVGANKPVLYKDRDRAQEYITQLNKVTGKNFRLPTEAEWEYACYGGRNTKYCGGDDFDSVAWFKDGKSATLHVGQKQPNSFGLYDMSGNVWEWMSDCWKDNCEFKILRGGSFQSHPLKVREAYIYGKEMGDVDIGFRLAGTLNEKRDGLMPVDDSASKVERHSSTTEHAAPRVAIRSPTGASIQEITLPGVLSSTVCQGDSKCANNTSLHVIGIYESRSNSNEIVVNVTDDTKPIVLALTSYEQGNWKVILKEGVKLKKVILVGYGSQFVTGVPPNTPIDVYSYAQSPCDHCWQGPYIFQSGGDFYHKPAVELEKITGLKVTTFQGRYEGNGFSIFPGMKEWSPQGNN